MEPGTIYLATLMQMTAIWSGGLVFVIGTALEIRLKKHAWKGSINEADPHPMISARSTTHG